MRVATILISLAAFRKCVVASSDDNALSDALERADECAGSDDECALNQLQFMARKAGGATPEENSTESKDALAAGVNVSSDAATGSQPLTHPLYCQGGGLAVYSPLCSGANTCGCQYYCSTQLPTAWGWDPNCCGCGGDVTPPPMPAAPALPSPEASKPASEVVPLTHPRYCQGGGLAAYSPLCTGASTCGCQYYCSTVRPVDWGWDPNCCGCGGDVQPGAPLAVAAAAKVDASSTTAKPALLSADPIVKAGEVVTNTPESDTAEAESENAVAAV